MEHLRFTTIAHRTHDFCSPISGARADRLAELLDVPAGGRVLDVGCGKAEMLIRTCARFGAVGVGIDLNGEFLEEAWRRVGDRLPRGALHLHMDDAARLPVDQRRFDAVICMGASQAFGGFEAALPRLRGLMRPGGRLLLADGCWKRPPHEDYVAFLEGREDDFTDHAGNAAAAVAAGFTLLFTAASSDDEWDDYEGRYLLNVESWARENPEDPDAGPALDRIRRWHAGYLRWGRDTLGFGMYVLRK